MDWITTPNDLLGIPDGVTIDALGFRTAFLERAISQHMEFYRKVPTDPEEIYRECLSNVIAALCPDFNEFNANLNGFNTSVVAHKSWFDNDPAARDGLMAAVKTLALSIWFEMRDREVLYPYTTYAYFSHGANSITMRLFAETNNVNTTAI